MKKYTTLLLAFLLVTSWACDGNESSNQASDSGINAVDSGANVEDSGINIADSGNDIMDVDSGNDTMMSSCPEYPADSSYSMMNGGILGRYQWDEAIDGNGGNSPLDMLAAHCDNDANRDWSAFDKILFVSVPVW